MTKEDSNADIQSKSINTLEEDIKKIQSFSFVFTLYNPSSNAFASPSF